MHAFYIAMCNIGLPDWPAFQSQPGLCWPHLGPVAGVWLSAAIAAPRDWWQLFTDEAVFIIPVQGCTDQMDPDHPSTVRDTSVPVVAQSTNKSPAPWKAVVSHRGMDTDSGCLLKTSLDEHHTQLLAVILQNFTEALAYSLKYSCSSWWNLSPFFNKDLVDVKMNVVAWNLLGCDVSHFPDFQPLTQNRGLPPLSGSALVEVLLVVTLFMFQTGTNFSWTNHNNDVININDHVQQQPSPWWRLHLCFGHNE